MVKPNTKVEVASTFKNLQGETINMKIHKLDKSILVLLERKFGSSFLCSKTFICVILIATIPIFVFYKSLFYYFAAIIIIFVLYFVATLVLQESVIMVKSLGYQVTTKYVIGQSSLFIPSNQVQNIFINEVILRNKVIHVLMLLTKENEKTELIPLFLHLQPRLRYLEVILKHLKAR